MELFEDDGPAPGAGPGGRDNAHDFTVSQIAGAVKRSLEDQFGRIRVRGEIGRVSRPASGHVYFDLKDDRAVLAAVAFKTQATRLDPRPEEGIEVIATGRLTTFPGQSKYQMIVERIELAGAGALMALLDRRRRALAAEGLFDAARKRPLPYLPAVIGVVTSPSGAVIRDILHRLRDRCPTRVLIWPVVVQGEGCAAQVAGAIAGLNALPASGPIARPDLLIVARGGGSLEDLMGFNDEAVVRAAAASRIPLIAAVGHETDTTLIDHAADRRAPTPTAAAEMAVPVRADLMARLAEAGARQVRASADRIARPRTRLRDLGRVLSRPASVTDPARQRLDLWGARMEPALAARQAAARTALAGLGARGRPALLGLAQGWRRRLTAAALPDPAARAARRRAGIAALGERLAPALRGRIQRRHRDLDGLAGRLAPALRAQGAALRRRADGAGARLAPALRSRAAGRHRALDGLAGRLMPALRRRTDRPTDRLAALTERLAASRARAGGRLASRRDRLAALARRLALTPGRILGPRAEALARLDRMRQTLGYTETLRRGFAVVHGPRGVVTDAATAAGLPRIEIEFGDGRVTARPEGARRPRLHDDSPAQGSLL